MPTVLDIDLDFFVTPVKYWGGANDRIPEGEAVVESIDEAMHYLEAFCGLPEGEKIQGSIFEHHDELFDYAVANFEEPIHLVHLDAHSDIGGGLTSCWNYVCTELTHQDSEGRRHPKRGDKHLNCGNFVVFLAAVGLLERVTFVSHPEWSDDYNPIYMKDFDPSSEALQLKRFSAEVIQKAGLFSFLYNLPHEVEEPIPFERITRYAYHSEVQPDKVFITRSPGYTPASADPLFDAICERIQVV